MIQNKKHEDPYSPHPMVYVARNVLASGAIPADVSPAGVVAPASVYNRWIYDRVFIQNR